MILHAFCFAVDVNPCRGWIQLAESALHIDESEATYSVSVHKPSRAITGL